MHTKVNRQHKTSVFKYDKEGYLKEYVDLDEDFKIKCFYNLSDNVLIKKYVQKFDEDDKEISETRKCVFVFKEDCKLDHKFLDGESRVVAIKKNCLSYEFPSYHEKIEVANDELIEMFTIKKDVVNKMLTSIEKSESENLVLSAQTNA